jgi:hypothetical protein
VSVDDYAEALTNEAQRALFESGALKSCPIHPDVTIRVGDEEAERSAYAIATNNLKRDDRIEWREDLMSAIKDELDVAADEVCPRCEKIMRE